MTIKISIPSNAKQFIRDYRLPLAASVSFVAIVLFLFFGRLHERAVLGQILSVKNTPGQDYANLLSKDKADDFKKQDVGGDDLKNPSASSQPSGSSVTASIPVQGTSASGSATTTTTTPTVTVVSGTTTPPTTVVPPAPPAFTATITDFRQDQAPLLQCSTGGFNLAKCSKKYTFVASVKTANGPGSVAYDWRYSVNGSNNGSFAAASGTAIKTLNTELTLDCKNPGSFTAQFVVTSPAFVQSQPLQINHSCP